MRLKNNGLLSFFVGPVDTERKSVFVRQVEFNFTSTGIEFLAQPEPDYWFSIVDIFIDGNKKFGVFWGAGTCSKWQEVKGLEQVFDMLEEKKEKQNES